LSLKASDYMLWMYKWGVENIHLSARVVITGHELWACLCPEAVWEPGKLSGPPIQKARNPPNAPFPQMICGPPSTNIWASTITWLFPITLDVPCRYCPMEVQFLNLLLSPEPISQDRKSRILETFGHEMSLNPAILFRNNFQLTGPQT